MPHKDKTLEHKFYLAFLEWFKNSGVDFWSECNAPESLANIADNLLDNFYLISKNRVKTLSVLQIYSDEIPEEHKNKHLLEIIGRDLAIQLVKYKKVLFKETNEKGFIEVRVSLDIIIPKNHEEIKNA